MPDRLIRDEVMRSRRFRRLPSDGHRLLFMYLLLTADSFGNLEADPENIGAILRRELSDEELAGMLDPLAEADLIRPYQADGKPLIHIPRYRQRLKYVNARLPRPPPDLEDPWIGTALQNKVLREKDGTVTATSQEDPCYAPARGSDVKRSDALLKSALARAHATPQPPEPSGQKGNGALENIATPKDANNPGQQWDNPKWVLDTAQNRGMTQHPGENYPAFKDRVYASVQIQLAKAALHSNRRRAHP